MIAVARPVSASAATTTRVQARIAAGGFEAGRHPVEEARERGLALDADDCRRAGPVMPTSVM